jgi:hypothetical protein
LNQAPAYKTGKMAETGLSKISKANSLNQTISFQS